MAKKGKASISKLGFRWFLVLFLVLFIGIRLINLSESLGFASDQGRDFLTTWRMYTEKQIVVLGPPSQYTVEGRAFFFGPAPYYVILPALLIGNWDPLFVSYYLILLNAAVVLIALAIFNKKIKDPWVTYCFAFFCIFTPMVIAHTRSYWNPHFMFPVVTLLVALLYSVKDKRILGKWFFLLIGFLFGLGLQFHYSFIFAIGVSMIWLLVNKKLSPSSILLLIVGSVLGFLPMIAYELKNNFYNLRTLFLVFTSPASSQNQFQIKNLYYFISLLPFIFLIASFGLAKVRKASPVLFATVVGLYALWGISSVMMVPKSALDYATLQKISIAIEADRPKNFNVVDQLTRDNQAMALRYMLTVHGIVPQTEGEYASAKTLYIYSKESLSVLLKDPVYEIKSFLPFSSVKTGKLDKEIYIYALHK